MNKTIIEKEILSFSPRTFLEEEKTQIEKAHLFATKAHEGQKRHSGESYVTHSVAVARNCAKFNADTATIVGALLHDTIEDTFVTDEEIEKEFGEEVLFLVRGVTKLGTLRYQGLERHVESMRKFFIALAEDIRVLIIKLADRLHNIETLSHIPKEKQKRIAIETIEIYAPLAGRLGMGKLKGLLEDYAFPFAYPEEYEKTKLLSEKLVPQATELTKKVKKDIEELLESFSIKGTVEARVKHSYSLYRKLVKYEWEESKINDIVALRVIVHNIPDCYQMLGFIHMLWKPIPKRIQDWIAMPKPNGYRSLHTTVITENGVAEIQIRTEEMHTEAEFGLASHLVYKESKLNTATSEKQKTMWLSQLKELSSFAQNMQDIEEIKLDFFSDRIFLFTPKGDVIDLPEGATPIDFAYAVHSEIGDALKGARVNNKMTSITTTLKSGDVVEILTGKNAHPSEKWLPHVKTSFARKKIAHYLELNNTEH